MGDAAILLMTHAGIATVTIARRAHRAALDAARPRCTAPFHGE